MGKVKPANIDDPDDDPLALPVVRYQGGVPHRARGRAGPAIAQHLRVIEG